ncbi:MAG: hypothetical protein RR091_09745 [Cloacibacillus sp.]
MTIMLTSKANCDLILNRARGLAKGNEILIALHDRETPAINAYIKSLSNACKTAGIKFINFQEGVDYGIKKEEITGVIRLKPCAENRYNHLEGFPVITKSYVAEAVSTQLGSAFCNTDIKIYGPEVLVIGRSEDVGKAIAKRLSRFGWTVRMAGRNLREDILTERCLDADIIVSATGQKDLITAKRMRFNQTLIDVGGGDINIDDALKVGVQAVTPKVGGIGPLTAALLVQDLVTK